MNATLKKHLDAIEAGEVTKANVIGIRKMINARSRMDMGLSVSRTAPDVSSGDLMALRRRLTERQPVVTGELHETGLRVLRNPRYAKRWTERQVGIIARLAQFHLVNFDRFGSHLLNSAPVYRAVGSCGQRFLFRVIAWQSGGNGPEIVEDDAPAPQTRASLIAMFDKAEHSVLIINAIHERGERQGLALDEMDRRGLWLSDDQKRQAGLVEADNAA